MRHPKYVRTAQRRSALIQLRRVLQTEYLSIGTDSPRKELLCEEVAFADRVITQEALRDVEQYLDLLIASEEKTIARFEVTERQDVALPDGIQAIQGTPTEKKDDSAEPEAPAQPTRVRGNHPGGTRRKGP